MCGRNTATRSTAHAVLSIRAIARAAAPSTATVTKTCRAAPSLRHVAEARIGAVILQGRLNRFAQERVTAFVPLVDMNIGEQRCRFAEHDNAVTHANCLFQLM